MNKAQLIHLAILGSNPSMERLLAVSPETTCSDMAQIINAAFGFDPIIGHFSRPNDGALLSPEPNATFTSLFDPRSQTIQYTPPTGRWCISIYNHGTTEMDRPLPQVIDAPGPDVFQPAFNTEAMEQMLQCINMLRAGYVQRQKEIDDTLNSFPNMSPEQIYQRLSQCHVPTVADRVWFAAMGQTLYTPLKLDNQPTGLQLDLGHHIIRLLEFFKRPQKLTKKGKLRSSSVREYGELVNANLWMLTSPPREDDIPTLPAVKRLFLQAGLIERNSDNALVLSEDGKEAVGCIYCATEACIAALPMVEHENETGRMLEIFAQILREPDEGYDALFLEETEAGNLNGAVLAALHAVRPNGSSHGEAKFGINAMGRELLMEVLNASTAHESLAEAESA